MLGLIGCNIALSFLADGLPNKGLKILFIWSNVAAALFAPVLGICYKYIEDTW